MAKKEIKEKPIELTLWEAANKLRGGVDSAEYKHVVLGLVFLKFASDKFEEHRAKLIAEGKEKYLEMEAFYAKDNVFYLEEESRWNFIIKKKNQSSAGLPLLIDTALHLIEKDNKALKGALPDNYYSRLGLDTSKLSSLIDEINKVNTLKDKEQDIIGRVYEYFLGKFAIAEGKGKGEFYTPKTIVKLIAEMIEPYKGIIYDPACGSGGMFVQSVKFIESHHGNKKEVSIYGQESSPTTFKLAKMNLAIRGIDSSNVKWNNEGSFLNDAHKDLKADFIIANPPFNVSDWGGEMMRNDGRWQYGTPPSGNANFAWMQHFLYHLAPNGRAGVVLAKGALTSKTSGEGDIRKALVENGLIDCIVNLPAKLFLNTQIPAALWFLKRNGRDAIHGVSTDQPNILFIDARNLGHLINRRTRELSQEDIDQITTTYHNWRCGGSYEDIPGFCASVPISKVAELDYVLTPGRYVGLPDDEDDFDFNERFTALKAELEEQLKEETRLNELININLLKIKI